MKISAYLWNGILTVPYPLNYAIHTDAIKEHIIPNLITADQEKYVHANEADLLNAALFGKTAKQWRDENPDKKGNMREEANIEQLLVLANIESMNAEFIRMGLSQSERLKKLNAIAINQLQTPVGHGSIKKLNMTALIKTLLTTRNCYSLSYILTIKS